jgi:hypothetical protein
MKGVLSWLVRWARRAGTMDFCPAFCPVKNIIFLTAHFHFLSHYRPATWAVSRAGLPISVSLDIRVRGRGVERDHRGWDIQ